MKTLDQLGTIAADTAMRAAVDYGKAKKIDRAVFESRLDDLLEAIRRHTKAAVGPALNDAREAFEAGMGQVAQATFLASMKLAGIAAGKEIFG